MAISDKTNAGKIWKPEKEIGRRKGKQSKTYLLEIRTINLTEYFLQTR